MATFSKEFVMESDLDAINGVVSEVKVLLSNSIFFDDDDLLALILREGLANAVKHGNKLDGSKKVHLKVSTDASAITFRIQDEGEGFNPNTLDSPLDTENLSKPSGRGIFLIRQFADSVEFNDAGNAITITILREPTL